MKKEKIPLHIMQVSLHINKLCSLMCVLNASAISTDSGQPAQSAQADLDHNVFAFSQFSAFKSLPHNPDL